MCPSTPRLLGFVWSYLKFACLNDRWHAASWSAYLSTSDISIFRDSTLLCLSAKWRSLSRVLLIFSKKFRISELSCSMCLCVLQSPFRKETVVVFIRKFRRTSSSARKMIEHWYWVNSILSHRGPNRPEDFPYLVPRRPNSMVVPRLLTLSLWNFKSMFQWIHFECICLTN